MGYYAEQQALLTYGWNWSPPPVPSWPKVNCPICGKPCGGRGDRQDQGVQQHMKFKHGIKRKWQRDGMLANAAPPDTQEGE